MSRICVKNLPRYVTEDRLREHFSQAGEVTDAKIMRTKEGKSRQFGFIGYRTEKEAESAIKYFRNTYLDTYKLICEVAYKVGDANIPRPWSRYSQKKEEIVRDENSVPKNSNKKEWFNEKPKASTTDKNDPLLQEFFEVMQPRSKTKLWANDTVLSSNNGNKGKPGQDDSQTGKGKKIDVETVDGVLRKIPLGKGKSSEKLTRVHVRFEDESDEDSEEDLMENQNIILDSTDKAREIKEVSHSHNLAKDEAISDMDYFKSKVKHSWDDEDASSEEKAEEKSEDESCEDDSSDENEDNGKSTYDLVDFADSEHAQDHSIPGVQQKNSILDDDKDLNGCKPIDKEATVQNKEDNAPDHNGAYSVENPDESENLLETGRLFIRNLPFTTSEDDLVELFSKYGEISQVHLVLDKLTKQSKGYAYVLYMLPESALRALEELDKSIFQGRLLHVIPAKQAPPAPVKLVTHGTGAQGMNAFKEQREEQRKASESGGDTRAWNSLFMHPDTIAENVARKYGVSKSDLLNPEADDLAVRMALGETHVIAETKKSLSDEGVHVEVLEDLASGKLDKVKRSNHILIIKNLPFSTSETDLVHMFGKFGSLERLILPPTKTLALAIYLEAAEARAAFKGLAYKRYKHVPLYLEWAPENILSSKPRASNESQNSQTFGAFDVKKTVVEERVSISNENVDSDSEEVSNSVFVKNLNFKTTAIALRQHVEQHVKEGTLRSVKMKGDPPKKENMGYCFVEFDTAETARNICKQLQGTVLDGHALSLQISLHKTEAKSIIGKKLDKTKSSIKIIVRNVAFEATKKDLRQLFSPFGQIKSLRLPKKADGSHRGFAFIEFITKQEAESAFNALSSSHLYGRHLVLEQAREGESLSELRARVASQFVDDNVITLNSGRSSKRRKGIDEVGVNFGQFAK